ncbi:MAG: DUF2779 domain-containing protein [Bdellovibrio sp.]|nr:DUF2779 domain-containing protein [Bdellovibrio sp.]
MKQLPKLLSKTKIMQGYQCPKNLYLAVHNKEIKIEITPDQQALFDQGNAVGEFARKRFSGGVLVDNKPWDFFGSLKKTRDLLREETEVIFEAAFEYQGCYARADIIQYSKATKRWTVYEVKSSTKLKDEYIDDVGLQTWIMKNSGLEIEKICVLHINSECIYPNLEQLFKEVDVTDILNDKYDEIAPQLKKIFSSLKQDDVPNVDIGPQCFAPYECSYKALCFAEKNIPELSVFNLPKIGDAKWDLYKKNIVQLTDERLTELSDIQTRMVQAHNKNERFVNIEAIHQEIATWQYPLAYLDFETIAPVIPRYVGTRPYQQVPIQFSVHIQKEKDGAIEHFEYLHIDKMDPRPLLIKKLLEACPEKGTIVAYYAQFEIARIKELADFSKSDADQLLGLVERFKDPLPLIREAIYDVGFGGSFSLKAVAPSLLGQKYSYDGMLVGNGTAAQRAFEEIISENSSLDRKQTMIKAMLEYCEQDTLVMVELVKFLNHI